MGYAIDKNEAKMDLKQRMGLKMRHNVDEMGDSTQDLT
jgi:hypothetical protein